jgi:hypothetical protein
LAKRKIAMLLQYMNQIPKIEKFLHFEAPPLLELQLLKADPKSIIHIVNLEEWFWPPLLIVSESYLEQVCTVLIQHKQRAQQKHPQNLHHGQLHEVKSPATGSMKIDM